MLCKCRPVITTLFECFLLSFQDMFPPNVYYKVFTHRPIVDLCAYSPRDYTAMAYKKNLPREMHNNQGEKNTAPANGALITLIVISL